MVDLLRGEKRKTFLQKSFFFSPRTPLIIFKKLLSKYAFFFYCVKFKKRISFSFIILLFNFFIPLSDFCVNKKLKANMKRFEGRWVWEEGKFPQNFPSSHKTYSFYPVTC